MSSIKHWPIERWLSERQEAKRKPNNIDNLNGDIVKQRKAEAESEVIAAVRGMHIATADEIASVVSAPRTTTHNRLLQMYRAGVLNRRNTGRGYAYSVARV